MNTSIILNYQNTEIELNKQNGSKFSVILSMSVVLFWLWHVRGRQIWFNMLISIIIPFYNGNDQIAATINSLNQIIVPPDINLEVVICDDGSDITLDKHIIQDIQHPHIVVHQDHLGQSAATNNAAKKANGEFIWLVAQDIKPEPNSLVEFLKMISLYPYSLIQGVILHDPALLHDRFTRYISTESPFQFVFDSIADDMDLPPTFHYAPHAFVNRHRFLALNGYDEGLPYGFQDTDFAIRWRLNGDRIVLARESIVYHNHLFLPDDYIKRQFQIGREAVNLFIKWGMEADFVQFSNLIKIFVVDGERDSQIALQAIKHWQQTGEEPPDSMVPDAIESAFNACFGLILRREFYRGINERIIETRMERYLKKPSQIAPDFQPENPFNWIGRLITEKGRKRE